MSELQYRNRSSRSADDQIKSRHRGVDGFGTYGRRLVVPQRQVTHMPVAAAYPKLRQETPSVEPTKVIAPKSTAPRSPFISELVPAPKLTIRRPPFIRRLISAKAAVGALAVCLVAFSVYVSFDALWVNQQARAEGQQAHGSVQGDAPRIDETPLPPNAIDTYKVAPNLPRVIRIESINVTARVLRLGVTTDNSLDTPKNSNDAGWYEGSAKPGEAGAMIVNGHYSGLTQPGVFHKLEKLKAGAFITIEKGDGTVLKFAVKKVEKMPASKVPMDQLLVSPDPKAQSLNLITCSGTFDAKNETYDQRVVVQAVAVR